MKKTLPPTLVKLREDLHRVQRVVSGSEIGLVFESPLTAPEWLIRCTHCSAKLHAAGSIARFGGCAEPMNQRVAGCEVVDIGRCQVHMCSPDATSPAILNCVEELVKLIFEICEIVSREEPLLQELATSWETLDALYETSLDLQSHDSLQKVTDRLLDRSIAASPDISAILWILEKDEFRAVAQRRCEPPVARPRTQGLVGLAHLSGAPIVADGCTSELVDTSLDLELRGSGPAVAIPVHTRQGLEAVLEVWRDFGRPSFETPAIRLLEAMAQQAASATENDRLYRAALDGECMRQEIEIGASIQQHLLFGKPVGEIHGGEIAHCMIPSLRVSGDFYAFIRHSDVCIDAVIGDVMGKGIPAALMGAATKIALLRVIAEGKNGRDKERLPEPAEIVTAANRHMCRQLEELGSFVTLFYARFDFARKTLAYVDAGHTATVHYIKKTDSIDLLKGEGFPLGFSDTETYQQSELRLGAGDIIFAYSDGMTEAADRQGLRYDTGGVADYLGRNATARAAEIARGIADDVIAYRSGVELDDDMTCLVVKLGDQAGDPPACSTHRHKIAAESGQLESLREWLGSTLRESSPVSIGDKGINGMQLALQEAATNIMFHGLQSDALREIAVAARFEGTKLRLELTYDGLEFTGKNLPPPCFDGSRDHGFGLFLINQLMDEVSYTSVEGHNTVLLSKELTGLQE